MTTMELFGQEEPVVKPKGVKLMIHAPELITKDLKLSELPSGHKRIRLSSNFLPLMGFTSGMRTSVEAMGVNGGLIVRFDPEGSTKVYERSYPQRKNNPLESQIDIQNQSLIDRAIPATAERLHFTIKQGSILIKALHNSTFLIRNGMKTAEDPFSSFVAMSSGIDIHCLSKAGFSINSLLEYRPQEARDKTDFTETGALNALANAPIKYLFNEDISKIDWKTVESVVSNKPTGLLHLSLQCDDFSLLKAKKLKNKAIETLDTSADLVYDGLRLIETVRPSIALIENVPGFSGSGAGELLRVKLRKWGYFVTDAVLDARQYKGLTSRKRYYLVASVWPGFEMPAPETTTDSALWPVVESFLHECRDVTHTSTVYKGIETGRSRIISRVSTFAPTIMKSQARQAKDSIYIEHEGRYYMPSEGLLRALNGFPESVSLDSVTPTLASEIIGQSIEYPMHHMILNTIREHIKSNIIS